MTGIVVLGAGFLGSALALGAAERDQPIHVIGRSDPYNVDAVARFSNTVSFELGDGVELLSRALRDDTTTVVIAAGGAFPVPSTLAPASDALGTLSMIIGVCEAVRKCRTRARVVLLSSAGAIYSPSERPNREMDRAQPTSPYGMSKLVGEHYLDYYRRVHHIPTLSVRCANIYGRLLPTSRGQGVVSAAFRSAIYDVPFVQYGNGTQERDFLHLNDFVGAMLDLLSVDDDLPPVLNISTGEAHSVGTVLDRVRSATRKPISTTPGPSGITDDGRVAADPSALKGIVDFRPMSLAEGIARMAEDIGPCDGPVTSTIERGSHG